LLQHVWPALELGRCMPVIDRVFDFAAIAQAHALMESSRHIGKILIRF